MFENFEINEIKPLLKGQVYERYQFTVKVQDDEFLGHYHEGEIQWLQPQPKDHLEDVENKVHKVMADYLE